MTVGACCCPTAARGQTTAAPPSNDMNSLRLILPPQSEGLHRTSDNAFVHHRDSKAFDHLRNRYHPPTDELGAAGRAPDKCVGSITVHEATCGGIPPLKRA